MSSLNQRHQSRLDFLQNQVLNEVSVSFLDLLHTIGLLYHSTVDRIAY